MTKRVNSNNIASLMTQWVKNLQCRRHRKVGLILGSGRSPEEGTDKPLQYSSGLQSKVSQRVRKIEQVSTHTHEGL